METNAEISSSSGYTGRDFEDWVAAARKYAESKLDLWPFQIDEMANDFAWRWEGCEITESVLEEAYEDWISGNNPYCASHGIELEGYDQMGQYAHDSRTAQRETYELAVSMGFDERTAQRLSEDIFKSEGTSMGIYKDEEYYREWIQEWLEGFNRFSPHHVPLDKLNLLEREERSDSLRLNQVLKTGKDWKSGFFDPGHMTDLS